MAKLETHLYVEINSGFIMDCAEGVTSTIESRGLRILGEWAEQFPDNPLDPYGIVKELEGKTWRDVRSAWIEQTIPF